LIVPSVRVSHQVDLLTSSAPSLPIQTEGVCSKEKKNELGTNSIPSEPIGVSFLLAHKNQPLYFVSFTPIPMETQRKISSNRLHEFAGFRLPRNLAKESRNSASIGNDSQDRWIPLSTSMSHTSPLAWVATSPEWSPANGSVAPRAPCGSPARAARP
jgi:hypothetical protein